MSSLSQERPYDQGFYAAQSPGSLSSARSLLGVLWSEFQAARVIDIGCGVGAWLKAASELGAAEIQGVDGPHVDQGQLLIDAQHFVPIDIESEGALARIAELGRFDLAMCLEVAEHLSYGLAEDLVSTLAALSDAILFSAATPFQGGAHHVNEQWPEFWAILFRKVGYECFDPFRSRLWYEPGVEWWYKQNSFLFVRVGSDFHKSMTTSLAIVPAPLSIIHPENYLFQALNAFRTFRFSAFPEEIEDYKRISAGNVNALIDLPPLKAIRRAQDNLGAPDVFPFTRSETIVPETIFAQHREALARHDETFSQHQSALLSANMQVEQLRADLDVQVKHAEALGGQNRELGQTIDDLSAKLKLQADHSVQLVERHFEHKRMVELRLAEALFESRRVITALEEQVASIEGRRGASQRSSSKLSRAWAVIMLEFAKLVSTLGFKKTGAKLWNGARAMRD